MLVGIYWGMLFSIFLGICLDITLGVGGPITKLSRSFLRIRIDGEITYPSGSREPRAVTVLCDQVWVWVGFVCSRWVSMADLQRSVSLGSLALAATGDYVSSTKPTGHSDDQ
jgi:hypothetical protein